MNEELKITEPTIAHVSVTRTPDPVESSLEEALKCTGLPLFRRSVVSLCAADRESLDRSGPIHVVQGNPIAEFGTGSLFQRGSARFIVTAAHLLSGWESRGYEVRIFVDDRFHPLAPGFEAVVRDENLDVAVVRLTDQAARCLHEREHLFVNDDLIDSGDHLVDGRYLIAGHLAHGCHFSEDRQTVVVQEFNLWTRPSPRDSKTKQPFGFLEFPTEPTFTPTSLGISPALPTVGGLSGANVWRIWQEGDDLLSDWDGSKCRVAGLQVSESGDRTWLKCTLWKYIMPLVDRLAE